jgi:hypothetical protein
MFRRDEKNATVGELRSWLSTIERKLLGVRWDDHEMRRSWEADRRRVSRLIETKAQAAGETP